MKVVEIKPNVGADDILEEAKGKLADVVVLGWRKDGTAYFESSIERMPEVLWLLRLMEADMILEKIQ